MKTLFHISGKIQKKGLQPFLILFPLLMFTASCTQQKETKRPNIIFIMADDHAYQAISAYGSDLIQTPNIDRLADEGMRFDRAFVTNSICAPSRAVILTGKFSHLNGLRDNIAIFDSTLQTYPKLLQHAGYETAVIGKWHLKSQPTGFDYWRVLRDQGDYYQPVFRTPEGYVVKEGYVTDVITKMAVNWIKNRPDKEKPFLLLCQHKAPHREWLPAQRHLTDFMTWNLPEPATLHDDYSGRGRAAREAEMRINLLEQFLRDCGDSPSNNCLDYWPGQAEQRTTLHHDIEALTSGALADAEQVSSLKASLGRVDSGLRRFLPVIRDGLFVWNSALEPAYPPQPYWWLWVIPAEKNDAH